MRPDPTVLQVLGRRRRSLILSDGWRRTDAEDEKGKNLVRRDALLSVFTTERWRSFKPHNKHRSCTLTCPSALDSSLRLPEKIQHRRVAPASPDHSTQLHSTPKASQPSSPFKTPTMTQDILSQ